ncbi:hypothetical protein SDC49_14425 [Lactobacillus sp. R2/2]|nr:hypothetical protein [Lactobacillus sp. R2/2]
MLVTYIPLASLVFMPVCLPTTLLAVTKGRRFLPEVFWARILAVLVAAILVDCFYLACSQCNRSV